MTGCSTTLSYDAARLQPQRAHDGTGQVAAARVLDRAEGALAFVDFVGVPRGTSIGRHTHGDDEEIYVVLAGTAEMVLDGEVRVVGPGDVVVNRPGGTHELRSTGPEEVRLVVIDIRTPAISTPVGPDTADHRETP